MDLYYKKDSNGQDILSNEDGRHQIMMEWEKPYIEKSIEVLNPYGKVLEIGFGFGYSATKICSFKNVIEYNVIECTPIVWEKFEEFKAKILLERPELKMNLIKGRWEDVLQTTDKFDCIYFDDYILEENQIQVISDRVSVFLYKVLKSHTKLGSKISFYSGCDCIPIYKDISCIRIECNEYNVEIPNNCKYVKGNKMYIPIITKISDIENDLKDKLTRFKSNIPIITTNKEVKELMRPEIERQIKSKKLFDDIQKRSPSCGLIIVDNFYNNPIETRNYILTQEFMVRGNYPGQRTISYANIGLKETIQKYVEPFGGKIIDFPIPKENDSNDSSIYNGAFQYVTSRDHSWVHIDGANNWAGVLYMTPNAPVSAGTAFYKFYDGSTCKRDIEILANKSETDKYSQDLTKWQQVDKVGNIFNRLILFNSNNFHMSMDYFGDTKENSRLFQVFFFSTER